MRRWATAGLAAVAVAAALLGGASSRSEAAGPCALTPVLLDTTINQGLQSYAQLVRGKETLVRFYFGLPTCSLAGSAIQVNRAQLTVKNQSASGTPALVSGIDGLAPVGTSTAPLITSPVKQIDATSDPKWVVNLVGPTAASFNASFEVLLKWQSKACATCVLSGETSTTFAVAPGTRSSLITKTVAARTNALRMLIVPLALPPGGLSTDERQQLQNALTVLSRGGPFSDSGGRLGSLSGATSPAGIRYEINSGFVDLTPLLRPTDGLFCGNNSNFATISSTLASMLQSFNSLNPTNPADKVVGVVPGSLSVASAADATCFEGQSSPGGVDSWVRLGTLAGSVFMQEITHDWGIQPFSRSNGAYHSIYTTAHAAAGDPGKTYNVLERAYLRSDGPNATVNVDRTALINNINNGVSNSNALLENADWNDAFCFLGGPIPTLTGSACTATRTVNGTAVGVAASAPGPAMQITAHTDGTIGGTHVTSTFVDDQLLTGQDPGSDYHIVGRNTGNGITIDFRAPASPLEGHSNDGVHVDEGTVLISSTVSRPSGTVKMELWHGAPGAAGSVKLATAANDGSAPSVEAASAAGSTGLPQIAPGGSRIVKKAVNIAAIPKTYSKPNVYLLADTTASMTGALTDVKASANAIVTNFAGKPGDPCFGVGDYKDFLSGDPYAFKNALPFTGCADSTQASAAETAIGEWAASGGLDNEEGQLFALHRIAAGDAAFESDSQKILIWFGDQPGHDPICGMVYAGDDAAPGITTDDVASELRTAGITVYPIGVTPDPNAFAALDAVPAPAGYTGCPTGANAGLQATRIANATGGVVTLAPSSEVSETILKILNNQPATVVPSASCDTGLSVAFAPTSQTALTPTTMTFTETVTAAAGLKPGPYSCQVSFAVNGTVNPDLNQTLSFDVTALNGAHTVVEWQGDDNSDGPLHGDVAMKCGDLFHIIKTNVVSDAEGHFVFDTPAGCPGGEIYVSVNDGWFVTPPFKAGDLTVNNTAAPPIVEISSPTDTSRILQFGDIALAGSGTFDNGTPVAGGALSWKLDGNSVGTGPFLDLRPPSGGWTTGVHTVRLEGPEGSFSELTITILGDNDNDGVDTAQETAINSCRPGGPLANPDDFPFGPYNATEDNDGDLQPNSSDSAPCTAETDFEATALFVPGRFDVSKSPSFSVGGVFTPYVDLKQVPKSNVRITKVAGIDVSGPEWNANAWVVSARFDGMVGVAGFSGAPLANFVNAHPALLNHTILVRIAGTTSDGSKGFHADGQVYVFKSG